MPITEVQRNSGGYTGTSGPATLAATTAGNTVVIVVGSNNAISLSTPSGFVRANASPANAHKIGVYHRANVPAGETSWTITSGTTGPTSWAAFEFEGIDPLFPVDVWPGSNQSAAGTPLTVGPTPQSSVYDGLVLAAHGINGTTSTPPTWSGQTGGVVEQLDVGTAAASTSAGLAVSWMPVQSLGAFSSTADASLSGAVAGTIGVFAAAGAKRGGPLTVIYGFEWLTTAGLTVGGSDNDRIFATSAGSPEIVDDATKARTGSGYLRLSATAAAENAASAAYPITGSSPRGAVARVPIRFDGGLPTADVDLFSLETDQADAVLRFRVATGKLGVTVGAGSEVLSDAAVTADQWLAVGIRLNCRTTAYAADWQVVYDDTPGAASDPVEQTQATATSVAATTATIRLGWAGATTPGVPVLYDDVVFSIVLADYPLGDHRIVRLGVDAADTVTISGTAGNFRTFTANGTLAAWDATVARGAIDEIPPTIGASADGVAQNATAASDYIQVPLETYDASGTGTVRSLRVYLCGWAASATTALIGLFGWDGTTETSLHAVADDPAFDNSTTSPAWMARMWRPSNGWTQAQLDAAAVRLGKSTDASPAIGAHMVMAEAAVQVGVVGWIIGEAGGVEGSEVTDPLSGGVLSATVDTPADQGATLFWDDAGTPGSQVVGPSDTHTEDFDAPDATTITEVGVTSDNEDPDRP